MYKMKYKELGFKMYTTVKQTKIQNKNWEKCC